MRETDHNPFRDLARLTKAQKLLDLLIRYKFTTAMVRAMDVDQWNQLAVAAGVIPPSKKTKGLVLRAFRKRVKR